MPSEDAVPAPGRSRGVDAGTARAPCAPRDDRGQRAQAGPNCTRGPRSSAIQRVIEIRYSRVSAPPCSARMFEDAGRSGALPHPAAETRRITARRERLFPPAPPTHAVAGRNGPPDERNARARRSLSRPRARNSAVGENAESSSKGLLRTGGLAGRSGRQEGLGQVVGHVGASYPVFHVTTGFAAGWRRTRLRERRTRRGSRRRPRGSVRMGGQVVRGSSQSRPRAARSPRRAPVRHGTLTALGAAQPFRNRNRAPPGRPVPRGASVPQRRLARARARTAASPGSSPPSERSCDTCESPLGRGSPSFPVWLAQREGRRPGRGECFTNALQGCANSRSVELPPTTCFDEEVSEGRLSRTSVNLAVVDGVRRPRHGSSPERRGRGSPHSPAGIVGRFAEWDSRPSAPILY